MPWIWRRTGRGVWEVLDWEKRRENDVITISKVKEIFVKCIYFIITFSFYYLPSISAHTIFISISTSWTLYKFNQIHTFCVYCLLFCIWILSVVTALRFIYVTGPINSYFLLLNTLACLHILPLMDFLGCFQCRTIINGVLWIFL